MSKEKVENGTPFNTDGTEQIKSDLIVMPVMSQLANLKELPPTERIKMMANLTSYTSAPTERIDNYVNMRLMVTGGFVSPAKVKAQETKVNEVTGEIEEYTDTFRTVIKFNDTDGKPHTIGFVSIAAKSFFENFIFPVFGSGDFDFPVPIKISNTATEKGRTYAFQIIE